MKVCEVMDKNLLKIAPDMDILRLAKEFASTGRNGAIVIDGAGKISGIVTETDFIFQEKRLHIPTFVTFLDAVIFLEDTSRFKDEMKKMAATSVADIMTEKPITISSEAPISEAATLMIDKDISHLPVMENGMPVGMVDKKSLLKAFISEHDSENK